MMLRYSAAGIAETTSTGVPVRRAFDATSAGVRGQRRTILTLGVAALGAWVLVNHAPLHSVPRGDVGVRTNQLTGTSDQFREGSVLVLPGLHEMRLLTLRDQV